MRSSDYLVETMHTPYDPDNLPEWWPENEEPLLDLSRPRIWSPDGKEELIFPIPIVFQNDPYAAFHDEPAILAFINEFERGRLHFVSGTNPPITRMEMIMIEQAEIQNGRMVDYHKWVIQFAEQMITRFPGGDPNSPPGASQQNQSPSLQDCSNGAIGGLNPGPFDCAPEFYENRMLSPGDDEVTEPRFIGHEYIYKHFTPEELDIELAYEGDIFQQLSYIYHAFRVGGYRGAPAAFAHVLPQALSDFVHQLGYTGPIIAQANGGMYPFPNDYMDFQVYRTMPRPFAEIYNERMRQREVLKPGDNGKDTSHENPSDTTVMMVTNVLIGNASIGYSNNIEAHPVIKEAKKDQLFERLVAHGTPSPGIDPKSLKPVLSFQDKGLPFPVPKPVEHMDEHPDVNFIVDNRMSQDKMPSANDQLPVDPDIIAVFGVDFEADEALKQQSLSNDEDQENMSLIEFAKGDNPSKGTIQTQQHTIQANTSSPNPDNGTAAPKPLAQVDPNTLNADIQPSGNAETHKVNGSEHVGGNNAQIGAAIKRPISAASSVHGFEFELHFEVLEGRLEKPEEDSPLLEACFEANGMAPAAFDLDVVDSTGFIKTRRIGIHEDSKEKVGAVCDEVVHFATGYTHLVIHELKETPAYDEYGDDTDDSDYEFHPDNYSPEDFDEFFGEEAQYISDALYTEAREMDLEAEEEEKKRMMKKAMAKKKKKRSRKGKGKEIYYDSDDDSNSDSDSDIDTPPPVKKARAPRKKATPRKKRTEGVLAINNSRGNQPITIRDDPTLVKVDKAKVAARLRKGNNKENIVAVSNNPMPFNGAVRATIPNGTVRQAPPTKSSYRPIKHASAKLKKAAILKAADKKRSRFEEPIAKGDNTGFPVPKKDNLGQPVALTDRSNQPRKSTKIVAPVARVPEPNLQALSFNEKNQLTAAWLDEVHDLPAGVPDPQPIQSVVQDDASFFQGAYAPKNPDTNQIEDDYAALQQLGLKSSQMMRSEENPQRQAFQVNEYTNDMAPLHMMESHQIINFKEQPQYQTFQVNNYTNKLGRLQMMGSEEYPQRQSFQGFQGFQSFQGFQGFQSFQDPEYHHKSFQSYDDIDLDPDFEPDLSAFETNESQNTANNVFDPQYNMGDYIPGY